MSNYSEIIEENIKNKKSSDMINLWWMCSDTAPQDGKLFLAIIQEGELPVLMRWYEDYKAYGYTTLLIDNNSGCTGWCSRDIIKHWTELPEYYTPEVEK